MKKRLLITSIVMMLVVAVALSTATYAWFTSSATVTANSISMTAATNNDAALGIGWGASSSGSAGTEISSSVAGVLSPMAPKSLATSGSVTTTASIDFNYATTKTIGGKLVFNTPITNPAAAPILFKDGDGAGSNSVFFVKNLSPANSVGHVYIIPTIAADTNYVAATESKAAVGFDYYSDNQGTALNLAVGADVPANSYKKAKDGSSLVRIAVFKKGATNYELVCVFAQTGGANTVMGTIAGSSYVDPTETTATSTIAASPMSYFTSITAANGYDLGALDANASHDLAIIAWLDGAEFTDAYQNYKANISFTFQTTAPSND